MKGRDIRLPRLGLLAGAILGLSTTFASAQDWAAIAVDGDGRWGTSVGYSDRQTAIREALHRCGAAGCKITFGTQAHCIALAESRANGYSYGTGYGPTRDRASSNARTGCSYEAPAGTCRVATVACGPSAPSPRPQKIDNFP
jgi:hypothetical protein